MNLPGQPAAGHGYTAGHSGTVTFPATWHDLEWLVKRSPIEFGEGRAARRRCRALRRGGRERSLVSNHGGRHLDTTVTTCVALPEIVASVGGKAEVFVDGGIRRGTDIVKALALGARAVLVGRPMVWGLATGGADGVAKCLSICTRAQARHGAVRCGAAGRIDG